MMKFKTKKNFKILMIGLAMLLLLMACSPANTLDTSIEEATVTVAANEGQISQATESSESSGPITLNLWLPPKFSNFSGDLASALLQQRLDLFHELNPNVQIYVRLKAEDVSGGLIDSLSVASVAAPLALPDLVLMNERQLETAIQEELVMAINSQLSIDLDWFAFSNEMVTRQSDIYALPFTGDAMIIMHRFSALDNAPNSWSDTLSAPLVLGFPAGNPDALFTRLQYASLLASEGRTLDFTSIDADLMLSLLNYYEEGQSTGIFPFWLSQFENDEQSWQAFLEGRMPMVATWSNRYFLSQDDNHGGATIPSFDGEIISWARAWAWAITSPDNERQILATKLAEFLSDAEFMAQWSSAAGYLPARESALAAWVPNAKQALALQVASNAMMVTEQDLQGSINQAISEAVIAILKQELSAQEANSQLTSDLLNIQ